MRIGGLLLFLLALVATRPVQAEEVRYHGTLIRVPDIDRALSFYSGVMKFAAEPVAGGLVRLKDANPVYLERYAGKLVPPAPDEAKSSVAFLTHDLVARMEDFQRQGVRFARSEPGKVGVGIANRFLDPFGNSHSLLQQTISDPGPFEEPKVYNSGFKHDDASTAEMRRLFIDTLGFVVRSERYYPPSLPIGHADGSFAFMLHENEAFEQEVRRRSDPGSASVSLILSSTDLEATRRKLADAGFGAADAKIAAFPLGRRFTLVTPAGVPLEIWQLAPSGSETAH